MELSFALVGLIVFFAFFTQAATGFGGLIISLTLSALLYPIDLLLTWLVPLVLLLSAYLLIRYHDAIDWRLLLKVILPWMGGGMIVGQWLFYTLESDYLKPALGILVTVLALRELLRRQGSVNRTPLQPWALAAGVVHGIFASGGPLLVYGVNGQNLSKAAFRSSLTVVWVALAVVLCISYILSGKLTTDSLPQIGMLALVMPFSILLGELAHHRINEARFKQAINVILVFCGVALLLK